MGSSSLFLLFYEHGLTPHQAPPPAANFLGGPTSADLPVSMRILSAGDLFTHYGQAGGYIGLSKVLEGRNPGVPSCAAQSVARLTAFYVGRGHNLRCGEWHCAASIPVGQTRLPATSYLPGLFGNIGCHSDAFLAEVTVKRRLQLNLAQTAEKYNMHPQDGTLGPL